MQKQLLQLCLLSSIWLKIHEKSITIDNLESAFDERCSKLRLNPSLAAIPDKDQLFSEIFDIAKTLCTSKNTDQLFFDQVSTLTLNWNEDLFNKFASIFDALIMEDEKISEHEKECMAMLAAHLNRPQDFFLKKSSEKESITAKATAKQKPSHFSFWKIASLFSFLFFILLLCGIFYGIFQYFTSSVDVNIQATLDNLKKTNKLVIKQVQFSKFVIAGTPQNSNKLLDKLNIFLVSGEADIQFPLSNIEIGDSTSKITHTIELLVPNLFPEVIVRRNDEKTYLAKVIDPEPINETTAENIAKGAGVVGGATGAVISAKLGGVIGESMGGPIGKFFGGFLGAAGGGGTAAYASYIATKNFILGLNIAINSLADKEVLLNASLPLIKLELMGAGYLEGEKWEDSLKEYYKKEFENRLTQLLVSMGWEKVIIKEKN